MYSFYLNKQIRVREFHFVCGFFAFLKGKNGIFLLIEKYRFVSGKVNF